MTTFTSFCLSYVISLIKMHALVCNVTFRAVLALKLFYGWRCLPFSWSVRPSITLVETEISQQLDDLEILYRHSWSPEGESNWLLWFPDFSSSSARLTFCLFCLLSEVLTTIGWIGKTFGPYLSSIGRILMTFVSVWEGNRTSGGVEIDDWELADIQLQGCLMIRSKTILT